jgi:hypothetical protein
MIKSYQKFLQARVAIFLKDDLLRPQPYESEGSKGVLRPFQANSKEKSKQFGHGLEIHNIRTG